jgi:hypothetical protein
MRSLGEAVVLQLSNPDEPELNRRMMSSQKIEVGHTLKSKNIGAFLLFKRSETSPGHRFVL